MKIAILGAGASGLFLSYLLTNSQINNRPLHITVFERNKKVGRKLLTTGNGRCNITNENISYKNFHSLNTDFFKYAINQFDYNRCKKIFNDLGIEFHIGKQNRAYPMSLTSSSVVDLLYDECLQKGVDFKLEYFVETVEKKDDKFLIDDQLFDKVILATGSKAMPKLGSNQSGYEIAKSFGHTVIEPIASLVQLVCEDKDLDILNGVKIDGIIQGQKGDILFTKYGISGSAVLDISREISYSLQYEKSINISIDTIPKLSKDKLNDMILKRAKNYPNRDLVLLLDGIINKKLSRYIFVKTAILTNKKVASELNRKDIQKVTHMLKNLKLKVIDTKGFDSCEVCAGGVDTTEVDNKTMQSKLQKGLYFTGEVLDVDGDCGGYNLHWAWASSYILSKSI